MPRPRRWSAALLDELAAEVEAGSTIQQAAAKRGLDDSSIRRWVIAGRSGEEPELADFAERIGSVAKRGPRKGTVTSSWGWSNIISNAARRRLRASDRVEVPPLRELVPQLWTGFDAPDHLGPLVDRIEQICTGVEVHACISEPPQTGKTKTCATGMARFMRLFPHKSNAYCSYAADRAEDVSKDIRRLAGDIGVPLDSQSQRAGLWKTRAGGGLLATGVGGPLTGWPIDGILLIDDPFKNREEAESRSQREKVWTWFTDVALTRLHPGASVLIAMARWNLDDLTGRIMQNPDFADYEEIRIPAILDEDTPQERSFWSRRSLEFWKNIRAKFGPYSWASLYQGNPRPRGDRVFEKATLVDDVDLGTYRCSIGLDFAYTKRTRRDYCVAVVLAEPSEEPGKRYVVEVLRLQEKPDVFLERVKALLLRWPATCHSYVGQAERGLDTLLDTRGVSVKFTTTTADKFLRAQSCAAAWNNGLVPVLKGRHWTHELVTEVEDFTGQDGRQDDQADALVAAWDALEAAPSLEVTVSGRRRVTHGLKGAR